MPKQPEPHEHWNTDELVCPYCGYEFNCSYDVVESQTSGTAECEAEDCGKTFRFCVDTTIEYTTERMPDNAN